MQVYDLVTAKYHTYATQYHKIRNTKSKTSKNLRQWMEQL